MNLDAAPAAFLYANATAAFVDADGRQIEALQAHGWRGLHEFLARHPTARVYLQGAQLDGESAERLLQSIATPAPDGAPRGRKTEEATA